MERKFSFCVDEVYHLYNRGVNKQPIFLSDHDRFRFLILLYLSNSEEEVHISNLKDFSLEDYFSVDKGKALVEIIAYCLMPNHFHLLVKETREGGISKFMAKLLTGYGMYFNKKNERTGPVFEGCFKAKHIDDDAYLEYLLAYIHLNPVKIKDEKGWNGKIIPNLAKAKDFLGDYRFSSYPFFLGQDRPDNKILNIEAFSEDILGEQKNLKELIKLWSDFEIE
ncbi:MAG TPA: transposase [Candidatus Paceibacterota bacterium]|nr:transposase [Candidatus Paceibacterota bacterium]